MININADILTDYCSSILQKAGVRDDRVIAECLVEANLRGTDSHGVLRLPIYIPRFEAGAINPAPAIASKSAQGAAVLVDGDNGLGHVVGRHAMDLAIELARKHQLGFAAVRDSNHFGAASYFALRAAENGMVGISASNTCPAMPAPGARSAVVGNGPLSIAIPVADGEHICLDISTSAGAYGKVLLAAREDKEIPEGWAVDKDGKPTRNAQAAIESQLLLPFAGHKGFGIAFIIDALCAAFGNTYCCDEIPNIYEDGQEAMPGRVAHIFFAISADAFGMGEAFLQTAARMARFVQEAPRAGPDAPKFPGEIEARTKAERLVAGIPLENSLVRDLNRLGAGEGLRPLVEEDRMK